MSRARALVPAIVVLLAGLALPGGALAQGGGPPGGAAGRLDVALSTASVAFPTPAVADFDGGFIDHPGILVSVKVRPKGGPWELRIRADDPTMGGYGKPLSDLLWRVDGSTVWTAITGTDQAVTQGAGDQDVTIYFRLRLDWAVDSPSAYAAGLTFTAVPL